MQTQSMEDRVIEAAKEVHSILGSGHTESTYHSSLEAELSSRGIGFVSEGTIPIFYKDKPVGTRRPDLFVEIPDSDEVIVLELKAGTNRGSEQLGQYLELVERDSNFGKIRGGILIMFNDELSVEQMDYDSIVDSE